MTIGELELTIGLILICACEYPVKEITTLSYKQLYRSVHNRRIAGVAGGIAEYFGVDPTPIRLLWLLAIILGGTGILVYLIAWLVIPEAPAAETAESQPANTDNSSLTEPAEGRDWFQNHRQTGFTYVGIFLILLGVFFLLNVILPWRLTRFSWAFLLVALGVLLIIPRQRGQK